MVIINNIPATATASDYDPDNPENLGINKDYVAYIYNRVYRFINMTRDDFASMIDNPYTPIYHESFEGFINYHSTSSTKYFPLTVFLYNRPTFIDEQTTFSSIVQAAQPLIGKDLQVISGYDQPAKVGPLFLVDAFHIYSASIQYTPLSYQSPDAYDWYNNNYHQYRSAMTMISNYVGIPYKYTKDPMVYATNISSIAVFYMPTVLGLENFVTNIGKDPYLGEDIITAGLVVSIVNYNTGQNDYIAAYYPLNPLQFRYMYNSYRLTMPDIVILLSPAAGLTEDDYNYLKEHIQVPVDGVWYSLPDLFIEAGARVVIATRMLPDVYKVKFRTNVINDEGLLADTISTFPYIANDILTEIFDYLSDGEKIKDVVNKINSDIQGGDFSLNAKYISLRDYYEYLILQTDIIQEVEDIIIQIVQYVETINDIVEFVDFESYAYGRIDEAISLIQDYLNLVGGTDFINSLYVLDYVKALLGDINSVIEDAIIKTVEELIIISLGILDMFKLDNFDTTTWQDIIFYFMSTERYGLVAEGNVDYHLGDTISPPSPPSGWI